MRSQQRLARQRLKSDQDRCSLADCYGKSVPLRTAQRFSPKAIMGPVAFKQNRGPLCVGPLTAPTSGGHPTRPPGPGLSHAPGRFSFLFSRDREWCAGQPLKNKFLDDIDFIYPEPCLE